MLKKIFLMLAALIFTAQIQTAYADVAIPVRPPVNQFPVELTVQSIDEKTNQVTLKLTRRQANLQRYYYSVYRESGLYIAGDTGEFHNKTELITFTYKDLDKDMPENLKIEIETIADRANTIFGDKQRQRPNYLQMNYTIEFIRYGDELTAEVQPYDR